MALLVAAREAFHCRTEGNRDSVHPAGPLPDEEVPSGADITRRGAGGLTKEAHSLLAAGGARVIALPVSAAFAFLTTHILIADASPAEYALVSLILSFVSLLPFGDLGLGAAITNRAATSTRPEADPLLHGTLLTSLRVLVCAAGISVVTALLITALNLWPSILGGAALSQENLACGLAMMLVSLLFPLALGQRLLIGLQRTGLQTLLQSLGTPLAYGLTVLAIFKQWGLPGIVLATPVGMVIAALLQMIIATRISHIPLSAIARRIPRRTRYPGVPVKGSAAPMLIITLALPLALQSHRLVLSHAVGTPQLAEYSLGLQFYSAGWSVVATAGLALWPIFASARLLSDGSAVRRLRSYVLAFSAGGVVLGVIFVAIVPKLSRLVGGGRLEVSTGLAIAFALLLVAQAVQLPLGMFMTTDAGLKVQAILVIVLVGLTLPLALLGAQLLGAPGPVLASALCVLLCQAAPGALWIRRRVSRNLRMNRIQEEQGG